MKNNTNNFEELNITSVTGQKLDAYLWLPSEKPLGLIQIVHGMSEYIDRYNQTAIDFTKAGFAVFGHTQLGHGSKASTLGYFDKQNGWDLLLEDIDNVRKNVQQRFSDIPYFLLGHSMGSFLVRTYIQKPAYSNEINGIVISGTGQQSPIMIVFGKMIANLQILFSGEKKPANFLNSLSFGNYNKNFKPTRTNFDWLSTNNKNVDKYISDPLCGFPFTAKGYDDLFDGLARLNDKKLYDNIEKNVPICFISGEDDPVGKTDNALDKAIAMYKNANFKDITVRKYQGGRHEMFNETDRDLVINDLIAWINSVIEKI